MTITVPWLLHLLFIFGIFPSVLEMYFLFILKEKTHVKWEYCWTHADSLSLQVIGMLPGKDGQAPFVTCAAKVIPFCLSHVLRLVCLTLITHL